MICLGIDGALGIFSVALSDEHGVTASRSASGNVALEQGLPLLDDLLDARNLSARDIDRLGVGIGPGGFTGLRIAVTYAKALAQAWGRPLVAVSSFDALELGLTLDTALTVVSGRPGVISARYRTAQSPPRRASGRIGEVLDAVLPAGLEKLTVVGAPEDVLAALAERAIVVHAVEPIQMPPAAAVALAARACAPAALHEVRADYGELPAARVRAKRTSA